MNRSDGTTRTRLTRLAATLAASVALGVLLVLAAATSPALAATLQAELPVTDAAAGDNCGGAVAISADTAVVGAPLADPAGNTDAGVVYIFVRSSGVWKLQQRLTAVDGAGFDRFGSAVAISGNTVVVGARYSSTEGIGHTGGAYVYVRSAGVWKLQQELKAVDAGLNDDFGWSVAVSGNTVVVGARDRDTWAKTDAGAAYVFVRFGTTWATQQILSIPAISTVAQDHFGESVAVSGTTALVGVPDGDVFGSPNAGLAYVYTRSGVVWTAAPVLYAVGSLAAADRFGGSVSLSGNTAVIGAAQHDVDVDSNAGAAYHFERVSGVWGAPDQWYAVDHDPGDYFGSAVAVSGTYAAIGATWHATATVPNAGAVYPRSTLGALPVPPLSAALAASNDYFGSAVAVSGDTILAGAPWRDSGGMADSGAAFAFQPAPTIYSLSPTAARRGAVVTITGTGFGRSRGASFVKFGATKCTRYVSWSTSRIRCQVPARAAFGARTVRVTLKVGTSNGMSFRVKR